MQSAYSKAPAQFTTAWAFFFKENYRTQFGENLRIYKLEEHVMCMNGQSNEMLSCVYLDNRTVDKTKEKIMQWKNLGNFQVRFKNRNKQFSNGYKNEMQWSTSEDPIKSILGLEVAFILVLSGL